MNDGFHVFGAYVFLFASESLSVAMHTNRTIILKLQEALSVLPEEYALNCAVNVPIGPYHVQLVDEERKTVVEIVSLLMQLIRSLSRTRRFNPFCHNNQLSINRKNKAH